MSATVAALSFAAVKGTQLQTVDRMALGRGGFADDRRFYLVDQRGRMLNGKHLGALNAVVSELHGDGRLRLTFPNGDIVDDVPRDGEPVWARFYSRMREDRAVVGPWSATLSDYLGQPVRLLRAVAPAGAVDRGAHGALTLISAASVTELAAHAAVPDVDARRFRMLVEVDGIPPHAEDAWVSHYARIGSARVRFRGHVGRCLVTSRDPDTGEIDLATLDLLEGYRSQVPATEPLPFGIYGEVVEPGVVAIGDPVHLEDV